MPGMTLTRLTVLFCSATFAFAMSMAAAKAEVVRCEVSDRTHRLMPAWIEYELRDRGTILEIRDALGASIGVDWVRGEVLENARQRLVLAWDNGPMEEDPDWWAAGRVTMTLTRLADGTVLVVGIPAFPKKRGERYNGRAVCSS
jgi:hypothetical protein